MQLRDLQGLPEGSMNLRWLTVSRISTSTNSWSFQTVRLILGKNNLKGRILITIPLPYVSKCQEQVGFLKSHPLCRPDYLPDSVSCLFEYNTDSWKIQTHSCESMREGHWQHQDKVSLPQSEWQREIYKLRQKAFFKETQSCGEGSSICG